MENGFIFKIVDTITVSLNYLNLVELFKLVASKLTPESSSTVEKIKNCNIAIDIFIVVKWSLLVFLWENNITGSFWTVLTLYLIWSNYHTYFYYHVWKAPSSTTDFDKSRRRFVALILAIFFNVISFGYLYSTSFVQDFNWSNKNNLPISSLLFSTSQSFFLGSSNVSPVTDNGELLATIQSFITFIFIVIILAKSVPQGSEQKRRNNGVQK